MSEINIARKYYENDLIRAPNNIEKPSYFFKFLWIYYNIKNIEDCINWCYKNINLETTTINRVLDVTWEVILKNQDFETEETMDKIVLLYIYIYKTKYNKDIDYHIMDKILRNIGKKLLNTKLLYNSGKSYQKEIKNLSIII
jgi:hypothetical protein